jgi:hypothetical protein
MISRILHDKVFEEKPPVIIDIGASGNYQPSWKEISAYSICIGFDADKRETDFGVYNNDGYRKHFVINKIITDFNGKKDFFLTKSPFCSSTLLPDKSALQPWYFEDLFDVQQTVTLDCANLSSILSSINISYVDWFKTDSQGTDLRIFKSLGSEIIRNVLIAEFEPGMMDAYIGEDKLYMLMEYMDKLPFWITNIHIGGTQRLKRDIANNNLNKIQKRFLFLLQKTAPYWIEISYFNSFRDINTFDKRGILLGCAFALAKKQYGFAYEIAEKGESLFKDSLFSDIKTHAFKKIKRNTWYIVPYLFKRVFEKTVKQIFVK